MLGVLVGRLSENVQNCVVVNEKIELYMYLCHIKILLYHPVFVIRLVKQKICWRCIIFSLIVLPYIDVSFGNHLLQM